MSKPTLLLNPGIGWAATTPFHYTLTLDNNYAHMGHKKENWYLKRLYNYPKFEKLYEKIYNFKDSTPNRPSDHPWGNTLSYNNRYSVQTDLDIYTKAPPSIHNYIQYYKNLWEVVKNDYAAVCDFSNCNFGLPIKFWQEIAPILQEHFDVKVTFQFRDPIRRYFSEVGSLCNSSLINEDEFYKMNLISKRYRNKRQHKKLFFHLLQQESVSELCYYREAWLKFTSVFGEKNCYGIIMEDFWDKTKEKPQLEALSNFLSHKITKVHENCYVPDMGSNPPHYEFLKDQWTSDLEDLTEADYNVALLYMNTYYMSFKETFGFLPKSWKK